jgi:hypothetical protein
MKGYVAVINTGPSLTHCLVVAQGLRALFEAESYADGSVPAGRFYHVRQVKYRGQTKGVSNSSWFGGRLVFPPVKMCSPRNLIQGLGLDGTV